MTIARRTGVEGSSDRAGQHPAAVALVADTLKNVAVSDAGGREEDIVAGDEVVAVEHFREVVSGGLRRGALLVVARPQPPE